LLAAGMLLLLPMALEGVGIADKEILKKTEIRTENQLGNSVAKMAARGFPTWHPDEINK